MPPFCGFVLKRKNRNNESTTSKQKASASAELRVASPKLVLLTGLFRGAAVGLGFRPWIQNFLHLGSNTYCKGMKRWRTRLGVFVYLHFFVYSFSTHLTQTLSKLLAGSLAR